jgi:hypothetical protein
MRFVNVFEAIGVVLSGIVLLVLSAAFMSLPVMLLWDWLMPALFGLGEITWFQAWGLMFLCGILFKPQFRAEFKK